MRVTRRLFRYGSLPLIGLALACAGDGSDAGGSREPATGGADSGAAGAGGEALRLAAEVAVLASDPVQIRGSLRVENATAAPVSFDVGGCPVFLRVYGADGGPIWDQGDGAICTMILRTVTLEPGATETFETATASAADILGEELPDGAYVVGVYLALVEGEIFP